jgi:hypothetical protein
MVKAWYNVERVETPQIWNFLWKKSEGSKATHTYSNKMKKEKKNV